MMPCVKHILSRGLVLFALLALLLCHMGNTASGYTYVTAQGVAYTYPDPEPQELKQESGIYNVLYNSYIKEKGFCWFCGTLEKLLLALDSLTAYTLSKLSKTFAILVSIGLLFVILFKTGQMLFQLQEVDPAKYLQELINSLGRGMIAVILLLGTLPGGSADVATHAGAVAESGGEASGAETTTEQTEPPLIFKYGLNDLLAISFDLSSSILNAAGLELTPEDEDYLYAYSNDIGGASSGSVIEVVAKPIKTQVFDTAVIWTLIDWMVAISKPLAEGMVLGGALIYHAIFTDVKYVIFPNFILLVSGVLLLLAYFLIYIKIPFQLLDAFVRLAFVCALMPFWIVLWVFPATRAYTKKAFQVFLGVCFFFIAASVILALILKMYEVVLVYDGTSGASGEEVASGMKEAIQKMKADDMAGGVKALNITGMTIIFLWGIGYIARGMLKSIDPLASAFESAGKGIAGVGAQTMMLTNQVKNVVVDTAVTGTILGKQAIVRGYRGLQNRRPQQSSQAQSSAATSLRRYEVASRKGLQHINRYSQAAQNNVFTLGDPSKGTTSSVRRTDKGAVVEALSQTGQRQIKTYDENGLKHIEAFDSAQHSIIKDKYGAVLGERQYTGTNGDFIQTNRDGSRLISKDGLETKTKLIRHEDGQIHEEVVSSQMYGVDRSQVITTEKNDDGTVSVITENRDTAQGNRLNNRQIREVSENGETLSETQEQFTYDKKGNFQKRDTYVNGELTARRTYDATGYRDAHYQNGRRVSEETKNSQTFFGQRRRK